MKKATLNCPREKVFFKNLLVHLPRLPFTGSSKKDMSKIEVNIIEELGEKTLILLPEIISNGNERIALVNTNHLD